MSSDHPYLYPKCTCQLCTDHATQLRALQKYRRIQRQRGVPLPTDLIPAGPYTAIVRRAIREEHMSIPEVRRLCGVGHASLKRVIDGGPGVRIERATATRIVKALDVDADRSLQPGSRVPSKRSRQIVHSLRAQGWTVTHQQDIIEKNLGESGWVLAQVLKPSRTMTAKATEDRIVWLSQAIGPRIGPSSHSANKAKNMGYFPLKHYSLKGDLIESTLSEEQRAFIKRVP